jgi:putative peptide zinc metalloprotease protein
MKAATRRAFTQVPAVAGTCHHSAIVSAPMSTPTHLSPPKLRAGIELIGPYQDSGLIEPTFLVRTAEGRMVQLSALLFSVLSNIDGTRTPHEIARFVSDEQQRNVSAENIDYLVTNKLEPIGLTATATSGESTPKLQSPSDILVLKARRTILPARLVQTISHWFSGLFHSLVVALALVGLIGLDVYIALALAPQSALLDAFSSSSAIIGAMGISIVSMLFHEIGHAAACSRGGATSGKIGFGLFIVWPAFFTDVTDSYRLNRKGRLRVDLGGIYFNAIFALVTAVVFTQTESPMLLLALVLIHTEMAQQLLPTLRLDGHLLLADIIGVPDLFERIWPVLRNIIRPRHDDPRVHDMRKRVRAIVVLWVCGTTLFITAELVWLTYYGPELATAFAATLFESFDDLSSAATGFEPMNFIAALLATLALLLPAVGLGYVIAATIRQLVWLVRTRTKNIQVTKQQKEREHS